MRLILWRHGRTTFNAIGRVQGQLDVELDEVGLAQAAESAVRVAQRQPTHIVSSDLQRASRTAAALADLTGLPVRLDPRLRERHFGPWQGLCGAELRERYPEDYGRWPTEEIANPEIETIDDMAKRVAAGLRDAIEQAGEDSVIVVVTHGGTARVGCGSLLHWPHSVWPTLGALHNCHRTELVHRVTRGWQLDGHNLA
jgi:probable phosphoglycerate mutase